jgi:hypothetical protein
MKLSNDPQLIELLRVLKRRGHRSSDILRELDRRGLSQVRMMSHLREAFDLDFDDVSCIGGWFADGAGELGDEAINALLEPAIKAKWSGR